jgi:cytochrome P450
MQVTSGRSSIVLDDPFEEFAQARAEKPVYWDTQRNIWRVHSYADVERALGNYKEFSSKDVYTPFSVSDGYLEVRSHNPLVGTLGDIDPPHHRHLRSFGQQSFTIRHVEQLSPRIYQIVHELFNRLERKQEFEFIAEFARQMPLLVMAAMFDIPEDDNPKFLELANGFVRGQPAQRLGLFAYFDNLIKRRRTELGEDLISGLLRAPSDGHELKATELLGYCMSVLYAGSHTLTYNANLTRHSGIGVGTDSAVYIFWLQNITCYAGQVALIMCPTGCASCISASTQLTTPA